MCLMLREREKANMDNEVGAVVRGQRGQDLKTRDQLGKGGNASVGGSILDWVGGRPTHRMVNDGEDVSEAMNHQQGAHQVQVDVREATQGHIDARALKHVY